MLMVALKEHYISVAMILSHPFTRIVYIIVIKGELHNKEKQKLSACRLSTSIHNNLAGDLDNFMVCKGSVNNKY